VLPTDEESVIARHTAALFDRARVSESASPQVEMTGPALHG
jgi:hypothetical protein